MTREEARQILINERSGDLKKECPESVINEALYVAIEALKKPALNWIPLTTRSMTANEKEHYTALERIDIAENGEIFDCPLPNDSQEVLVSHGGYVYIDTFYNDSDNGCYFESLNIDEVDAWMPLPVAFERKENAT